MSCKDEDYSPETGLELKTWTQLRGAQNGKSHCTLTAGQPLIHCVEIRNWKTYGRRVFVRSEIMGNPGKARFNGPATLVRTESRWEDEQELLNRGSGSVVLLDSVLVENKASGQERILIKVSYADSWNPTVIQNATDSLNLGINLQ